MFPPKELAQTVILDYKVVIITINTTIYYVSLRDNTVSYFDLCRLEAIKIHSIKIKIGS